MNRHPIAIAAAFVQDQISIEMSIGEIISRMRSMGAEETVSEEEAELFIAAIES